MGLKKVLVTGAAGFIGYHTSKKLVEEGFKVIGLDNINDYYSTDLKYDRLKQFGIEKENIREGELLAGDDSFSFYKCDLEDKAKVDQLFEDQSFNAVINLAAQAGVRYSLKNPYAYIDSNITGFLNILEAARHNPVDHFIYASSSSVYGANTNMPFSTSDNIDHPMSLYAATKKADELMAHTYSNLYNIPTTGLRFFTVYGPWGRPDMALFLFTEAMLKDEPIKVFNHGKMERDFTYVDDIVEGVYRLISKPPEPNENWTGDDPDPATSFARYQVFNIGNSNPVKLMDFIGEIENQLGIEAEKNMMDMQPGDVAKTWADVEDLFEYINFRPQIGIQKGIKNFIHWYQAYYNACTD